MAGAPPPDFGGDHVFGDDPENMGMSTIVNDMAALNLQLIHILRRDVGDADRDAVDAIADRTRQVLAAGRVAHRREQATRELQPITRLLDAPYGANENVHNIRMNNLPAFTGSGTDTMDVVRWISRVLMLADSNNLSYDGTLKLMIQASTNGASDYIEQMRSEGKTVNQVIQQLEMRYGDLCTPEEARVKCNNMPRKEGEGLPEFIDRLWLMARMACRMGADEAAIRRGIDLLVEGNIRRVLPSSVRSALEERVINRSRMGLPAFTAREVEKECLDLEKRREDRREQAKEAGAGRRHGKVLQVEEAVESEDDFSSSADEVDPDDNGVYNLIQEIRQVQKRYDAKGRPYDPRQVNRRAVRNYNEKYPPRPNRNRAPPHGARQAAGVAMGPNPLNNPRPNGPPNRLDVGVKRTVPELLAMANIEKGSCVQCGVEGHYMHQEQCVLKDKLLVDRPCAKCGKGLHSADDCPRVYQNNYMAPQQAPVEPQANVVQGQSSPALNSA